MLFDGTIATTPSHWLIRSIVGAIRWRYSNAICSAGDTVAVAVVGMVAVAVASWWPLRSAAPAEQRNNPSTAAATVVPAHSKRS